MNYSQAEFISRLFQQLIDMRRLHLSTMYNYRTTVKGKDYYTPVGYLISLVSTAPLRSEIQYPIDRPELFQYAERVYRNFGATRADLKRIQDRWRGLSLSELVQLPFELVEQESNVVVNFMVQADNAPTIEDLIRFGRTVSPDDFTASLDDSLTIEGLSDDEINRRVEYFIDGIRQTPIKQDSTVVIFEGVKAGKDPYTLMAAQRYRVGYDEVTPRQRSNTKDRFIQSVYGGKRHEVDDEEELTKEV